VNARLVTLIIGSSIAATGLGALLPYLYTDIATTRQLGGAVAALTFTVFALGSLVAAPLAGRLADGPHPLFVAASSRILMALGVLGLGFASSATATLAAAAVAGVAYSLTQPAISVLVLAWTPEDRSRQAFAAQFVGLNLALAAGGFTAGLIVNLSTHAGTHPIYVLAAAAELASAAVVALAGRGAPTTAVARTDDEDAAVGIGALLKLAPVRLLVGITLLLTLACYAQYDSGLPAYALGYLHVHPSILGTGVALNAIAVSALTVPVVALTRKHAPTTLLAWCAGMWIGCWLIIGAPLLAQSAGLGRHGGLGSVAILLGYLSISFGETMLGPVLNPFAATLAPEGSLGRTLAAVTGATTLANAIGPALSGVLLALDQPLAFIGLQLACCAGAITLAVRLGQLVRQPAGATLADDVAEATDPLRR
jgi:MFS family permease